MNSIVNVVVSQNKVVCTAGTVRLFEGVMDNTNVAISVTAAALIVGGVCFFCIPFCFVFVLSCFLDLSGAVPSLFTRSYPLNVLDAIYRRLLLHDDFLIVGFIFLHLIFIKSREER